MGTLYQDQTYEDFLEDLIELSNNESNEIFHHVVLEERLRAQPGFHFLHCINKKDYFIQLLPAYK